MAERDTYQIVLQLVDKISADLEVVKAKLDQTRISGQKTAEGVQGFTAKIKAAVQPVRDFSRTMSTLLAAGGLTALFMRVARSVGEMEKAYAKLHPESQTAVGSIQHWNESMTQMKAAVGEVVSGILTPMRAAFLDLIDPVGSATYAMKLYNDELQVLIDKYIPDEVKKIQTTKEAQLALTEATRRHTTALVSQYAIRESLRLFLANEPTKPAGEETYATRLAWRDYKAWSTQVEVLRARLIEANKEVEKQAKLMEYIPAKVNEITKSDVEAAKKAAEAAAALKEYIALRAIEIELMKQRIALRKEEAMQGPEFYVAPQQKFGSKAGAARNIGATGARTGLFQFENIELNSQLAAEGEELKRINDEMQRYSGGAATVKDTNKELEESFKLLGLQLLQDSLVGVFEAFGQAAIGAQSFSDSMQDLISSILRSLGPMLIQKGLMLLPDPLGWALMAAGGFAVMGGAMFGAGGTSQGIANPAAPQHFASGGVVSRPTLALLGESGPEAVVPLNPYSGRSSRSMSGVGGITIVAPNARYLDGRTAGQLVRLGLAAMRA